MGTCYRCRTTDDTALKGNGLTVKSLSGRGWRLGIEAASAMKYDTRNDNVGRIGRRMNTYGNEVVVADLLGVEHCDMRVRFEDVSVKVHC